jgi:hypothetical protein
MSALCPHYRDRVAYKQTNKFKIQDQFQGKGKHDHPHTHDS